MMRSYRYYIFIGFMSFFSFTLTIQVAFKEGTVKKGIREGIQAVVEAMVQKDTEPHNVYVTEAIADITEQVVQGVEKGLKRAAEKGVLGNIVRMVAQETAVELLELKKEMRDHMWLEARHEFWDIFNKKNIFCYGSIAAIVLALPVVGYYASKTVLPVLRKKALRSKIINRSIDPSTSSGRTERALSAAFTPEFIEGSGRTERKKKS